MDSSCVIVICHAPSQILCQTRVVACCMVGKAERYLCWWIRGEAGVGLRRLCVVVDRVGKLSLALQRGCWSDRVRQKKNTGNSLESALC